MRLGRSENGGVDTSVKTAQLSHPSKHKYPFLSARLQPEEEANYELHLRPRGTYLLARCLGCVGAPEPEPGVGREVCELRRRAWGSPR